MNESEPPRPSFAGPFSATFAAILLIAALAILPFWAGKPDEAGMQGIAKFIGRFHPVILHLPIGMLAWVLLLETGNLFSRKPGRPSSRMPMMFTALSAVIAALLGFVLYFSTPDYDAELVERHLYGGLFFACAAVATFAFKTWVDALGGRGAALYRILLLGCGGVMAFTSHDGASLTHGKGYLTDHAPDPLRKVLGMPVKKAKQSAIAIKDESEQIVYTDLIVPILEQKCYSCHNEEKRKGRFRMDEYELLLAGGKEGDGIVPGNSAQSNVVVRIELPKDDEEHMPPEGKKGLDDHEIALLKWWIDSGASKDAKMADLPVTDEVKAAIAQMIPPHVIEQQKAAADKASKDEAARRDSLKAELARLQAEYPAAINFESQDSARLAFTAVGMRKSFGDADLAKLEPVIPALVSLDLSATSVTDSGLRLLANAVELRSLRLSETDVTNAALDFLAELPNLESLNLHSTGIGNEAVAKLAAMTQLRKLYLWRTGVDEDGMRKLAESLPECEIVTGW